MAAAAEIPTVGLFGPSRPENYRPWGDLTAAVRDALARGWSEEQAAGEIHLEAYSHWDQYETWFPMNVRGVYRWLAR